MFAGTNLNHYFSINLNRDYGTKLELLRTKAKIPQKGVAIALGVSQEYYSSLERNEGNFKFEYVEKLADLYKMPAMDVAQFLWSDDKTIIHKIADTNHGAFTTQGSVVQNQGIDDQKLKVMFEQLNQMQEINAYLLQKVKALEVQTFA